MAMVLDQAWPTASSDLVTHVRTYRKFVHLAQAAACALPLFVAFLLYMTT